MERMWRLILHGPVVDLIALVPVTAIIVLATRLPIVQFRHVRCSFAAPVACAAALWIGPISSIIGVLIASLIDARFSVRDRNARIRALKSGVALAGAGVSAAIIRMAWQALEGPIAPRGHLFLVAWLNAAPVVLAFLGGYAAFSGLLDGTSRGEKRRIGAGSASPQSHRRPRKFVRLRSGVTLLGFVPLFLTVPFATVYGWFALAPLLILLAAEGALIRRAVEFSSLKRQLSVSQAMAHAGLADTATAEPTALLYRFLHLAQHLVHSDRSIVWMIDDETGEIIPAVGLPNMGEFAGLRIRLGEGLIGSAADRTRPLIVSDAARTSRRGEQEPAADSWLLYPIISQQKVLGVAQWTRPASVPFTPEEAARLEGLVPHVGLAVESMRAKNRMRELAATDGLTGLYNHRRTCELLRDEMRRAERYNRPLSVLMLDVDSFKSFNDTHGHQSGDQLLKSIAQILRAGVRTVDRVGRYGGEEFIIVMPETHKDDAFMLAERIRSVVEQQAFVVIDGEEIHRTVSVGVASYPEDGLNPQQVIERADQALYRAKDAGRNRVVWA